MLTGRDLNIASDEVDTGNILQLLSTAWDRLRPHLVETKLSPDALFREQVMYPEDACREALINAITHRDYSIEGQNIEILIYDDRMEVHSPGSLLSTIDLTELKKLSGIHESRNALIARVLREVGYVREMGEGMRRIFRLFSDADLVPPQLSASLSQFTIILHYKSVFSAEDQHWLAGFKRLKLTREEMLVALKGKDGQLIAPQQIYDLLNLVDWDIYRELIEQMYAKGVLYNTMTEAQKKLAQKRNKKSKSKRDIARLAVRPPEVVEHGLSELYGALSRSRQVPFIDGAWLKSVLYSIPKNNPYRSNMLNLMRLLHILDLMDEDSYPTNLLRTLWSAAPQPTSSKQTQSQARKPISPQPAKPSPPPKTTATKAPSDGRTGAPIGIYVGNLHYDASEQQVFLHFQQCGQVISVTIPKDLSTNNGRGFCFVKMATRESASTAIKRLDGSSIRGRRLNLNWAR